MSRTLGGMSNHLAPRPLDHATAWAAMSPRFGLAGSISLALTAAQAAVSNWYSVRYADTPDRRCSART